jgi:hypothetical protein
MALVSATRSEARWIQAAPNQFSQCRNEPRTLSGPVGWTRQLMASPPVPESGGNPCAGISRPAHSAAPLGAKFILAGRAPRSSLGGAGRLPFEAPFAVLRASLKSAGCSDGIGTALTFFDVATDSSEKWSHFSVRCFKRTRATWSRQDWLCPLCGAASRTGGTAAERTASIRASSRLRPMGCRQPVPCGGTHRRCLL